MSAPTGNTFAKGNRGGGRKSAYEERLNANYCWDLWEGRVRKAKIQKRIYLGKHGAKDLFALKILEGDEKMLGKLFDKLYPTPSSVDIRSVSEELGDNKIDKIEIEIIEPDKSHAVV